MGQLNHFLRDRRGSLRETTTMVAVVITVFGVGAALGLDHLTREGALPRIAILPGSPQFAERIGETKTPSERSQIAAQPLDYMPVGSIPGEPAQTVVLDPCTGARK